MTSKQQQHKERRAHPGSTWFEDVSKEPIRWVVPDYIPRRYVSSVYAPRNAGKTMLAVWLAAQLSKGLGGEAPYRTWLNSREDDLASVLRPRLDAASASLSRQVRLTANSWWLPRDLGQIKDELLQHADGGAPDDVLILDSIQQHIERPYAHAPAQESIQGLLSIAREMDMAVVLIGHTTRGKHGSVEAMIAGASVLQNQAKALYVFGWRRRRSRETLATSWPASGWVSAPSR
jgi:putative DNA primase/helicase